jgi:hypothetical protein
VEMQKSKEEPANAPANGLTLMTRCACPRLDARDCIAVRYGRDLRCMIDGDDGYDDDEECVCSCHDEDEDYDED